MKTFVKKPKSTKGKILYFSPILPISLTERDGKSVKNIDNAIIDTGFEGYVLLPEPMKHTIKHIPSDKRISLKPIGGKQQDFYISKTKIKIRIPESNIRSIEIENCPVVFLPNTTDVLLGMKLLQYFHFQINGPSHTYSLNLDVA